MPFVHPTALVSPEAELEEDVFIGPYCIVSGRVKIGRGSRLRAFVTLLDFVEIGPECSLHEHAVLGGEPQDHAFKGEESRVRVGSSVIIRENVTVHRSTGEGTCTVVGDGSFLMEGVHVGHNVTVGKNVTLANKVGLAGFSSVGDGAVLGGMAGVHQFVRVGKLCMIGGLSKIVKDIPPFLLADGHPADIYGLNTVGMRRAGYNSAGRSEVRAAYDTLFRGALPFRREVEEMARLRGDEDGPVRDILEFCSRSRRGVALWTRSGGGDRTDRENGH